jgi:alkylhydroperoxidase/carboxymuconolactone decarboxylase family protein YurZ
MFDMRNLTKLKKLDENAPEVMKAFWAFNAELFKDGAIDVLHKQLMAVAVALQRSVLAALRYI